MRHIILLLLASTLTFAQATQQDPATTPPSKPVPIPAQPTVPSEVKKVPGFSIDNMDRSAAPCDDFYQFACGNWRKNNPIPADQTRWGRFDTLREANLAVLRTILDELAAKKDRTQLEQQVGDFYTACMDESAVDAAGFKPIQPDLDKINAIQNRQQLTDYVASLHQRGIPAFFGFGASPDLHHSTVYIANLSQGGITLDKEDYEQQTPEKQKIRDEYVAHISKMLQLIGEPPAVADTAAHHILNLETTFANLSLSRVQMRDPKNRDHRFKVAEFVSAAPNLDLPRYFADLHTVPFTDVNVINPDFFKTLSTNADSASLDDLKEYLRWKVIHQDAPLLSRPFVDEDFNFFNRILRGQEQDQVRWKRCTRLTDSALGEALGQFYVKQAFGGDAKARMLDLVHNLEAALHQDIAGLSWMSDATKQEAFLKLSAIVNKIGYPDKWKDYSTVVIKPNDLVGNEYQSAIFERNRNLKKIDNPVDKSEWNMSPPTVNAYYSSALNEIVFPAGILQPPFYDRTIDDAVNYGGIGLVIGHELTHGFDDQGRKFDAQGNYRDWWTKQDGEEFEKRVSCIADEYSAFEPVPGVHLNGRLTLGENTADNGGSRIAFLALMNHLQQSDPAALKKVIDGFTPEQRFFLGFAQVWCENVRPEASRRLAQSDPHSPGRFRVIGTISNNPQFDQAFGCKKGQPMVRDPQCSVW